MVIKRIFHSPGELRNYLRRHQYPRFSLSLWAESPPLGETFLFSDTLRPLLEAAIGISEKNLQITPGPIAGEWVVNDLESPPLVQGASLEEAIENFWLAIETEIRQMGRECQLFIRDTIISLDLERHIQDWTFAESVRLNALAPSTTGSRPNGKTHLRLITN